jgi:hypothetical protein
MNQSQRLTMKYVGCKVSTVPFNFFKFVNPTLTEPAILIKRNTVREMSDISFRVKVSSGC